MARFDFERITITLSVTDHEYIYELTIIYILFTYINFATF